LQAGVSNLWAIVERCRQLGVPQLTVFAFSAENWKRSPEEVNALLALMELSLKRQLREVVANGIRLKFFGELERLPNSLLTLIHRFVLSAAYTRLAYIEACLTTSLEVRASNCGAA
jgi:undecaprenyl diphosphate synthase